MQDEIRLNSRRAILFFIGGATLCFATFLAGLVIGQWSTVQSKAPDVQAAKPAAPVQQVVAPEQKLTEPQPPPAPETATDSSPEQTAQAAEPKPEGPVIFEAPKSYLVRAASFTSASDAEGLAVSLRGRGFETAFARETKSPSGGKTYFVFLGPYPDTDAAGRAVKELRLEGVSEVSVVPNR